MAAATPNTAARLFIRRVGMTTGCMTRMPKSHAELLGVATRKLKLGEPATTLFTDTGDEVDADDFDLIGEGATVYVSCGEPWVVSMEGAPVTSAGAAATTMQLERHRGLVDRHAC